MPRRDSESTRAQPLLSVEVRIELDRDAASLHVADCEIVVGAAGPDDRRPRQVHWNLCDELLCDEMVLLYGRPLDWTGPVGSGPGRLLLVQDAFRTPIALERQQCEVFTGAPRVVFPRGVDLVAWSYGTVLVRGDDTPWVADATVRIRRDR